MTRRGGGGGPSKPAKEPLSLNGDPPTPPQPKPAPRPAPTPAPKPPLVREKGVIGLPTVTNDGGRRRRTRKHRKSHRKTRRGAGYY